MRNRKRIIRRTALAVLLITVWSTQAVSALGAFYARSVYPVVAWTLSGFSNLFPFGIGDVFIGLSLAGLIAYPFYGRLRKQKDSWKRIGLREGEYLLWVYVWFYLAWGLNYSQPNFYQRTGIAYTPYNEADFHAFANEYIDSLNTAYIPIERTPKEEVSQEVPRMYGLLADSLGIHRPPHANLRAKTMLYTPLASKVGVTGSMGPFFCEFTLNGDVLPANYPATYAHELAHLLGISSEAEANFYAYQICTRSADPEIRFSGYFFVLSYVLNNAYRLLPKAEYETLLARVRPEVIALAKQTQAYWAAKYSPLIGSAQNWLYDLYLKGNKIADGRKNYSQVVGLLMSYRERKRGITTAPSAPAATSLHNRKED
ncbi:MAG: DUF3810 domain-containing protein [Mediterranea sp.]|jgi:hypothetical protein|nr:DUF3810 domain-containing protein [Mediterranea sp.]